MQAGLVKVQNLRPNVRFTFPVFMNRYIVNVWPAINTITVSVLARSETPGPDGNYIIYSAPVRFNFSDNGNIYNYSPTADNETAMRIAQLVITGNGEKLDAVSALLPLPLFEEVFEQWDSEPLKDSLDRLRVIYNEAIRKGPTADICAIVREWTGAACAGEILVQTQDLRAPEPEPVKSAEIAPARPRMFRIF